MDDRELVELFWSRAENAIGEASEKYGGYCYSIAYGILKSREDAEESVSDTFLAAWDSMPPHRPGILKTFLGKLTRRISIDRWRAACAEKRGGGEAALALDELSECVAGTGSVEGEIERREMVARLNAFLDGLPPTERRVFLCRYWYLDSVRDIAAGFGFTQSKVASMLHRTRAKLARQLKKEGLL